MKLTSLQESSISEVLPELKELFSVGVICGSHWKGVADIKPYTESAKICVVNKESSPACPHDPNPILKLEVGLHIDPRLRAHINLLNFTAWAVKHNIEILNLFFLSRLDSNSLLLAIRRKKRVFHVYFILKLN